jgi:hypothetical protein
MKKHPFGMLRALAKSISGGLISLDCDIGG